MTDTCIQSCRKDISLVCYNYLHLLLPSVTCWLCVICSLSDWGKTRYPWNSITMPNTGQWCIPLLLISDIYVIIRRYHEQETHRSHYWYFFKTLCFLDQVFSKRLIPALKYIFLVTTRITVLTPLWCNLKGEESRVIWRILLKSFQKLLFAYKLKFSLRLRLQNENRFCMYLIR